MENRSWSQQKKNSLAPVLREEGRGEGPNGQQRGHSSGVPRHRALTFASLVLGGLLAAGCGKTATTGPEAGPPATSAAATDDHSGWWCSGHGVPEEICAQCNAKVAAEYQKKGDWCQEHNRPESQCFLCNPKLADKFAAEYEAKYGQQPPKLEGT